MVLSLNAGRRNMRAEQITGCGSVLNWQQSIQYRNPQRSEELRVSVKQREFKARQ